jgi:hypothetical protein
LFAVLRHRSPQSIKSPFLANNFAFFPLDTFAVLRHNPRHLCGQDCGFMKWHGQSASSRR